MTASRRPSTNSRVPSTGSMKTVISEKTRDCRSSGITKPPGSSSSARAETSTSSEGGSSSPTIASAVPKAHFIGHNAHSLPHLRPLQMISCARVSAKVSAVLGSEASFKTVPRAALPCSREPSSPPIENLRAYLGFPCTLHLSDGGASSSREGEASRQQSPQLESCRCCHCCLVCNLRKESN